MIVMVSKKELRVSCGLVGIGFCVAYCNLLA
jgi:hypothetical protein